MAKVKNIDWAKVGGIHNKSNSELAKELGVHISTVSSARRRLGISQPLSKPPIDWLSVEGLGIRQDVIIAKEQGVKVGVVKWARNKLGIPLKSTLDKVVVAWNSVTDIGITSDTEIGARLGIDPGTVARRRKKLGIPTAPTKWAHVDWDAIFSVPKTDQHVADMLGCSVALVNERRLERGIKPYSLCYRTIENQGAWYGEAVIDLWLHTAETFKNVTHSFQHEIHYEQEGQDHIYRVDWLFPETNEVWEYCGFMSHPIHGQAYRERHEKKKAWLEANGYKVREILDSELNVFKKEVDLTQLHSLGRFVCPGCRREDVRHYGKGMCATCNWRLKHGKPLGEVDSYKKKNTKVDWDEVPFADKTDAEIEKQFNVSSYLVAKERKKRNLPPSHIPIDWAPVVHRFGNEFDFVIAKDVGVTRKAVTYQRKIRGIPPLRGQKK